MISSTNKLNYGSTKSPEAQDDFTKFFWITYAKEKQQILTTTGTRECLVFLLN